MESATLEEVLAVLIDQPSREGGGEVSADNPYEIGQGVRELASELSEQAAGVVSGFSDLVKIEDDLFIRITNIICDREIQFTRPGENWLKLEFWIAGKESLIFQGRGQVDFEGRWCLINWHPEGIAKGEWVSSGEGIVVTIYCRPTFLSKVLGDQVEQLPSSFQKLALEGHSESIFEILPLTNSMANAVTDLIRMNCLGRLRQLYVKAKTLELFSSAVEILMLQDSEDAHSTIKRLTRSEIQRVQGVRDHILQNLSSPPKIKDLSSMAAMNQQKLQQIFKALYNDTIADFCIKNRMEYARKLLEQNEMNVTQVAHTVGYDYANNFSTAFRRFYGVLPKTYQGRFRSTITVSDLTGDQ